MTRNVQEFARSIGTPMLVGLLKSVARFHSNMAFYDDATHDALQELGLVEFTADGCYVVTDAGHAFIASNDAKAA